MTLFPIKTGLLFLHLQLVSFLALQMVYQTALSGQAIALSPALALTSQSAYHCLMLLKPSHGKVQTPSLPESSSWVLRFSQHQTHRFYGQKRPL